MLGRIQIKWGVQPTEPVLIPTTFLCLNSLAAIKSNCGKDGMVWNFQFWFQIRQQQARTGTHQETKASTLQMPPQQEEEGHETTMTEWHDAEIPLDDKIPLDDENEEEVTDLSNR